MPHARRGLSAENKPIPRDDLRRKLTAARPESRQKLTHLAVAGDTYTILVEGSQTAGRYCLIDMLVPPGGGPPPHRHDFEEMFSILEGEIQLTFRGRKSRGKAGDTIQIPANAPHCFRNVSEKPARLLCFCAPAGQERFFAEVGIPVATRTTPAPKLSPAQGAALKAKAAKLALKYRTEFVKP